MKYRLICFAVAVLILVVSITAQSYEVEAYRYHQHLEEEGYTPCGNHDEETFCTHLLLINIQTEDEIPLPYIYDENGEKLKNEYGRSVQNNEMVLSTVEIFDSEAGNNHLTDTPAIKEKASIRIRGNSSRAFPKKNYLLKFTQENGVDGKDVSIDGMVADNTWTLHGPILDKSLIRNYLCYNLSGSVMEYVPEVRFCELFINDEYLGIYLLTEKIDYNKNGRCNITKTNTQMANTSYILRFDKPAEDEYHSLETFFDYTGRRGNSLRPYEHLEIIYPSASLTPEQREYIERNISDFEKALSSFDAADENLGYPAYIDIDSFVYFYVLNEFMLNTDAGVLSTYLCKDIQGKIKAIGWDYDITFGNTFDEYNQNEVGCVYNQWYYYLLKNEDFVYRVVKTYNKLRKSILSDEYILNYIDETIKYLGPAIERNEEKWGYTYSEEYLKANPDIVLSPIERNPESFEDAVEQLKASVVQRGRLLDENIEDLYAKSHDSTNKRYKL